ncbi:MAG: Fic family protein [candidate division NC10 bacterium]|nr:Fic family protein [candidate division NC10 bacterium]
MISPQEKLAESLEALKELQERGVVAIRSADLTRTHRERLVRNGFLHEVMKGWYIAAWPDGAAGESTAWYATFWAFCAAYLNERFGTEWSLSPEQSLSLHVGNRAVPRQLLVRSPKARNRVTRLPHETSLLDVRAALPAEGQREEKEGLRLFSVPAALIACAPGYFPKKATDARAALAMVRDASDVLALLLASGHSAVAGRLAGAFRNIGRARIADDILKTMRAAGYDVRENDPFRDRPALALPAREKSPYVTRVRLMWQQMRKTVMDIFPAAPGPVADINAYIKAVEDVYVTDAYHSLSIEGYRVSPALIERVRTGAWNPDDDESDREHRNARAARGYWQAHQAVRESVRKVLRGDNPGAVVDADHGDWYRELFAPSVTAGIIRAADLAGYRSDQVYIRGSKHVPPRHEAVRDLMPEFFDLLREEEEPPVRVVLGHFVFVYIHPYMDGNGRMARFLMNVMLAGGGYPWTVLPVEECKEYMAALEAASVEQNIQQFAAFLARLVQARLEGRPLPRVPAE